MKECPACRRCFPDETDSCPDDGSVATPTLLGEPILDGRYHLERRLGQGGMGVVFKGRHTFLKTQHAIKVILPDLVGNDPMLATRFRQEALAAAAIRHPNVIAVTDFGVVQSKMPFLVMEFIKGKSLHDILAHEGPMPVERAWEFISALAAGVSAAHRQNIIHRDLKPLNVMVQDDVPIAGGLKILDFGLAKIKSGELLGSFVQAQTSGLMGSPYYMAPEQWSDEELDARADVYSLGVILYQMLCGDVPFKGSSVPSIMKKHLTVPPPTFQSRGVAVPPLVEAIVRHSLEKEVGARIESVDTFMHELRGAIDSSKRVMSSGPGAVTVVDQPQTLITGLTLTDTQPPGPGTKTQAPVPADTQFSTSLPSVPGDGQSVHPDKERRPELSQRPIAVPVEESHGSIAPTHDPEVTQVKGLPGSTAAESAIGVTRPEVGRRLRIEVHERKRVPPKLAIAGGIALLLVIGLSVFAYFIFRPQPPPIDNPTFKAELVPIDGGRFEMGRKDGPPEETPAHPINVEPFSMEKTEISNQQYQEFVTATNYAPPGQWIGKKPPAGQELWPVVGVSFGDANAFAAWRSARDHVAYRLPTEEEWEYAARNGSQDDLYPWGSDWQDRISVVKEGNPSPVGSRPTGRNKWGVLDLIGNVWEWTSSRVSAYPGNPIAVPDSTKDWVTIRGGSYRSDPGRPDRPVSSCMREFVPPDTKNLVLGFRLVRSGP